MIATEREPICQDEHEPDGDQGLKEAIVFVAAIGLTFASGCFRGSDSLFGFVVCASLAALAFGWLIFTGDPLNDNDYPNY